MAQRHHLLFRNVSIATAVLATAVVATILQADPPASQPLPTVLQQLSDQTQQLYVQSRHSLVRVKLPTPQWLEDFNSRQAFLNKWGPLMDPVVRAKFIEEQDRALGALHQTTTAPTTAPTIAATTQPLNEVRKTTEPGLALFAVGLIVDDQGHAVFPVWVDRKYVGDSELPAVTGDDEVTTARFVGTDALTNLTVLQLATRNGAPAPLGHRRPEDGVLTLAIAPDGAAKLVVWNNQHPEPGFAILTDGSVAGFGFDNHFLGASTAKPIVDQLIASGEVHRAALGVWAQEVGKDEIQRVMIGGPWPLAPSQHDLKLSADHAKRQR